MSKPCFRIAIPRGECHKIQPALLLYRRHASGQQILRPKHRGSKLRALAFRLAGYQPAG
jgi:hypothetical protein